MADPRTPNGPFGVRPLAALALMAVACPIAAEPMTVDLYASTKYSDDITRNEQAQREDFEHRLGIRLGKHTGPGTCEAGLSTDLAFLHYQRGTFSDQVAATADVLANCEPTPYFRWNLRNTVREVQTTSGVPDTRDNRERRIVFATGPTLIWPVTGRSTLFLDLEHQITRFQRNLRDDSDRNTATVRWRSQFTPVMEIGATASYSEIDIRRSNEELTQENVRADIRRRMVNGVLSGNLGYSWLTSEFGPQQNTTEAITGQLRYDHEFSGGTTGFFEARRTLTDASTDIDIDIPGLEFNLGQSIGVQVTNYSAGIRQRLSETTQANAQVSYTESEYDRSDRVETRYRINTGLTRAMTEKIDGRAGLDYSREDFNDQGRIVHTYGARLGFDYRDTEDVTWDVTIGRDKRDISGGSGRRYEEDWIAVGVTWNLR